jgi:hypothetical protein
VAERTLKERLVARLEGLKSVRQPYEGEWKDIASLAQPARSRFLSSQTNKAKRAVNKRLFDDHGIRSFRTLQNGMTAGLCSGSRPWVTVRSPDDGMMEDPEIKAYWAEVERRMYAFIAPTNFYGCQKTQFLELGLFGTAAVVATEHPTEGMVCHTLTAGEFWIGLNSAMQPGVLNRNCALSAIQAIQMFGDDAGRFARKNYDQGDYETTVPYVHAIEENEDYEEGRLGWRGKKWRSIYWEEGCTDKDKLAGEQGYDEQPFWAPRWDTTGYDAWGQGPGHDTLPSLRNLQVQDKRKGEATDMHLWPEIISASNVKLRRQPRSVVSVAASGMDLNTIAKPVHEVPYQSIGVIREDLNEIRMMIDELTYASLFMAITNMQGIQPRNVEEIASRNEEKMTQLGPVIERVNNEGLEVAIERIFGIMQRGRLLPPAPEKLRDNPSVKIDFVSILTNLQRMAGLGAMERTFNMVGQASALYPQARHKLDINEFLDRYAEGAGSAPEIMVPSEAAQEEADNEAQAAQNAQMAEQVANLAKPTKDLTDAATLAAELPGGGIPASQAILPPL